jgi:hypothetical protein
MSEPTIITQMTEVLLRKIRLGVRTTVSPYILRNAVPSVEIDHITNRMILKLDSHVLGQQEVREYVIVEEPIYPTWKHHFVASLPEGSWRRRYFTNFFLLEGQPLWTRRTHTVRCTASAVFPKAEITMPPELDQVARYAQVEDRVNEERQ